MSPGYYQLLPVWIDCRHDKTERVDSIDYCHKLGVPSIDAVYILLTWNGQTEDRLPVKESCQSVVKQGKAFVDILHKQYPQAQIKIMGLQIPSVRRCGISEYGKMVLPIKLRKKDLT